MKKFKKLLIALIIIIVLWFMLFDVIKVQNKLLELMYPIKYSEYVQKYANENNLDIYMVYAIIKAESNFNPNVKSHSDAIGLMQLLEDTAMDMSNTIENQSLTLDELYDPEINIQLGTKYFKYLLGYYNGNTVLALSAYNAGIGNVDSWIQDGVIKSDGSDIENIPYKETNNYVRKILNNYKMYLKLYVNNK